jgi:hypothetical protein
METGILFKRTLKHSSFIFLTYVRHNPAKRKLHLTDVNLNGLLAHVIICKQLPFFFGGGIQKSGDNKNVTVPLMMLINLRFLNDLTEVLQYFNLLCQLIPNLLIYICYTIN